MIVDRSQLRIRRNRIAPRFAEHNFLINFSAKRLIERLEELDRDFPQVLELGCHQGELTKQLRSYSRIGQVMACDMAAGMVQHVPPPRCVMDEELLPFAENSFDLVITNLTLHLLNDLPGCLAQIYRCLKPGGLCLISLLGGDTLWQWRSVFTQLEIDNASPRIMPFAEIKSLGQLLQRIGFALPVADHYHVDVTYPHITNLIKDVRGMGQTAPLIKGGKPIAKTTYQQLHHCYQQHFSDQHHQLIAGFDLITLAGVKAKK